MECGCRCMSCGGMDLESHRTGPVEEDGYYDRHHTCRGCGAHFDHLEGRIDGECGCKRG
ncbi:MAG: hypothetical protein MPI95_07085 [Nitrosopumilus sp.]|nr:hypothetical protein [Nitrosopumilus sp.]MDA7942464.1 hypothetical protein [Nitrosopumilus sp.]MDA7953519.1 hypothetical protein [Nitrosopumilus sp.]MDA7958829.1 hypothetical protein [Nitrosopumilus sp.]